MSKENWQPSDAYTPMPKRMRDDPEHWRERAEEARIVAEHMSDFLARETMLRVAVDYERLAEHAARGTAERSEDVRR